MQTDETHVTFDWTQKLLLQWDSKLAWGVQVTQLIYTRLKSTVEALEKGAEYVQS